jgi:hypothetical protein
MTRDEMISAVDRMVIYEKDYKTLSLLMANLEDSLFVKILEEILLGNLFLSDFERIFSDSSYASTLKKNLQAQDKLKKELDRLTAFRGQTDQAISLIGLYSPADQNLKAFYKQIKDEEIESQLYNIFEVEAGEDELTKQLKIRIFEALQSNQISKEDFLLFSREYILPISIEHQILNKSDLQFATQNNLSEDQVKKIKALSYFIRRLDYTEGE